jgi:DNA-directed RNA polymerase specialized sigma24 family protein
MDGPLAPFEELLARARSGDREAVGVLFQRYSEPILKVVRRRLRSPLRRRYDSCDFVQSVWASFVHLPLEEYAFASPDEFVAFLARVAYNKLAETTRNHLGTQKNDMVREVSLDAGEEGAVGRHLPSRGPTPSQVVIADECWQQITRGLPEGHVGVLELLRDGYSPAEICRRYGVYPKLVQRLLHRLRHYLNKE